MGTLGWSSTDGDLTEPAALSGAGELVIAKFNEARTYSESLWGTAINAMEDLKSMAFDIDITDVSWSAVPLMGLDGIPITVPDKPDIAPINIDWPTFTAAEPNHYDVAIPAVSIPGFNVDTPAVSIPDSPSVAWPTLDATVPSLEEVPIPTSPDVSLPPVPQLNFANIPEAPDYNIPEFNIDAPVANLEPPTNSFVWNEAEYSTEVYEQLRETVYNNLISGGSGLAPEVEQAIYDRATARQELENQQMYDNALDYFASRGAPLPPGALAGMLMEVGYKIAQTRTDLNNDILVNQAKLAQENTHFIIQAGLQLEQMGMNYTNALQQRAFDAAKYTIEVAVQLYGLEIETYKAKLAAYQVLAEVYRTRIMAETAKAELYRAQIDAVKAHTDIQMGYVQLYMAQLQGIKTLYEAYRTEMEGAGIRASIDRTKIESYSALVNAYATRVRAVTARYEAYQAQVAGELGKVEVYKAQTQAYATQVQAIATGAQVDVSRAQIALGNTQAETEVYKAKIQKYASDVGAKAAEVDSLVKAQGLNVDVYKADTAVYGAGLDTLSRTYASRIEEVKATVQNAVAQMDVAVRGLLGRYGLMVEATKGIAQVASQLGASAFAGVSASAHIGHGESRSDSQQYSRSASVANNRNDGVTVSTIHQYIHE